MRGEWIRLAGGRRLQLSATEQERIKKVVRDRALTNRDRRTVFEQIGEDLDFTAELIVSNAFVATWARNGPARWPLSSRTSGDLAPTK